MEQARRIVQDQGRVDAPGPERGRGTHRNVKNGAEEAVRLALVSSHEPVNTPELHFAAAIDIVRRAASTVRAREDRAEQVEAHAEAFGRRAHDEMRAAQARAEEAEARALAAEKRAHEAEVRLQEAQEWVDRLCAVLEEEFP